MKWLGVLLLSFMMLSCSSSSWMLHDVFFDGGSPSVVEVEEVEEEYTLPPNRFDSVPHDRRIPYDFSFVNRIDFSQIEVKEPEPVEELEPIVVEEPAQEEHRTIVLTGDQIVALACCFVFLCCLFTFAYVASHKRRRD